MFPPPSNLPPIITEKLRLLRRTLRNYVLLDGLATTVLAVVLLLGIDLVLDRFFEFSSPVRGVLLAALVGWSGYVIWRRIVRRLCVDIRDEQWALLVEHFVPELDESFVTAVGLNAPAEQFDHALYEQTVQQAAEKIEQIDHRRFFSHHRLSARMFSAAAALGMVLTLCVTFAETAEIWFARNIMLSHRDWPRRSRVLVEGFQNGKVRIGRGDSFTLTVQASTAMPLVPDVVRLRLGNQEYRGDRSIPHRFL